MTQYFQSSKIAFIFTIVYVCFALSARNGEINFYVVSHQGEALHFEKVIGYLGETRGFCKECDSTAVLLHGLGSSYESECNDDLAEGLLLRRNINVIAVDYSTSVEGPGYASAAGKTDSIGNAVGEFLLASQKDGSLSLGSTTLIGFDLGAHVAGVAGFRIRENSGYLGRIIGLDPTKPAFTSKPLESRLDRSDAAYVMVIHTTTLLGMENALGHADFYPNGGREVQPKCQSNSINYVACSHRAACKYLADSIATSTFIAEECSSWEAYENGECRNHEKAFMGYDMDSAVEGVFFLKTDLRSFEVVDVNTLSETDEDKPLAQYHWYPRSGASLFSLSTTLFSICVIIAPVQLWMS